MTLHISKFRSLSIVGNARVPCLHAPSLGRIVASPGAEAAATAEFGEGTAYIRVHTDTPVIIDVGPDPNASTHGWRMAAGQTEIIGVGENHKLSHMVPA